MSPNVPSKQFHSDLKEWGRWKHELLQKYLHVWVNKLSFRHKRLGFVDAFAGAGRYGGGEEGSPVIAAKWNDHKVAIDHNATLTIHACEADVTSAVSLKTNLARWMQTSPPRAFVYPVAFEDAMPAILEATKNVPTIFFIDPCGTKDITLPKLKPLLDQKRNKSAPLEVLVRVDPVMFTRFAGWLHTDPDDQKKAATAKKFKKLLTELSIDVEKIESQGCSPGSSELLLEYIQSFSKRFRYVQLIPIRPDYDSAPKYYLVHGTDSPDGAAKINDVLSTTEDSLFSKTTKDRAGDQGLLFEPEREPRVTIAMAKKFALDRVRKRGLLTFVDLCAELAVEFGPDLREKHHRRALKELVTEGRLKRSGKGAYARSTKFEVPRELTG